MITVCGEALIDLVTTDGRTFAAHPGGGPANVAVSLSRLGVPAGLLGRVSGDTFGRLIEAHLRDNGVDLRDVTAAAEPTTLAVASVNDSGGATYDFYVDGTADFQWTVDTLPSPLADDVEALYVGSLVAGVGPGAAAVEELLRREHERGEVTTVLDPNVRPALSPSHGRTLARVERQVACSDLVKASDEDLRHLYPGADPERIAQDWRDSGPAVVIITAGTEGALAVCRGSDETIWVPADPVIVVDTVGAGDSYLAGLLAALRHEGRLARSGLQRLPADRLTVAMRVASRVAGITASRRGADPPTAFELGW